MKEGHIKIEGFINDKTVEMVKDKLSQLRSARTIVLSIRSKGGSVESSKDIYDLLVNSGKEIKTIIDGAHLNIGSFISGAGEKINVI